jgi:exonuclease III
MLQSSWLLCFTAVSTSFSAVFFGMLSAGTVLDTWSHGERDPTATVLGMGCGITVKTFQDGCRLCYSTAQLRGLDVNLSLQRSIRRKLFYYHILRKNKLRPIHNIEVRICHRKTTIDSHNYKRGVNHNNLVTIDKIDYRLPVCLTANILSIVKKMDEIEAFTKNYNPHVLNFCETWLNCKIPDESISLKNFNVFRNDRTDRAGGGVATFVRDDIPVNVLTEMNQNDVESLWLLLKPKTLPRSFSPLLVVNVYHPPNADDKNLENHLISGLDILSRKHASLGIILTGDFNRFKLKSVLKASFQLKQLISLPTRKNAILDLFFTNMSVLYTDVELLAPIANSDHNTIIVTPLFKEDNIQPTYHHKRKQMHRNKVAMVNALQLEKWDILYKKYSCEAKFAVLNKSLNKLMDEHLPWTVVKTPAGSKPWVTDQFLETVALRNQFWKIGDMIKFKHYRNKANKLRKSLKSKHVSKNLDRMKDSTKWWSGVKEIIGTGCNKDSIKTLVNKECNGDPQVFVNKANDFFISVAKDIAPLTIDDIDELKVSEDVPEEFLPSVLEVQLLLDKIKLNKAIGPDGVPNWIWRDCSKLLAPPIASIVCSSMREGYWPQVWKSADVIALGKVPQPRTIEDDIRPIGLTSVLGKAVCESVMVKILWSFIRKKIHPQQFGVITGGSTVSAMIKLIDELLSAADKGKISRLLMIDFAKAFDRIDHTILINKLLSMGVPIWLCKWVAGFLSNRLQRVKYNGYYSDWKVIGSGVPQGTKFGPIGFIVLINNISADMIYVDDSSLVEVLNDPTESILNIRANDLATWATEHKMKLNAKKNS